MQQFSKKQLIILKIICAVSKFFYNIYLVLIKGILKLIRIVKEILLFIFNPIKSLMLIILMLSLVFALPLILKFLVKINVFANVEDFKNYYDIFLNNYVIMYLLIGIVLVLALFGNLGENIKNIGKSIKEFKVEVFRK